MSSNTSIVFLSSSEIIWVLLRFNKFRYGSNKIMYINSEQLPACFGRYGSSEKPAECFSVRQSFKSNWKVGHYNCTLLSHSGYDRENMLD